MVDLDGTEKFRAYGPSLPRNGFCWYLYIYTGIIWIVLKSLDQMDSVYLFMDFMVHFDSVVYFG